MTSSNQIADPSKILVLVVDVDDDLGEKGISTPIIGYENVLEKAIEFAKSKPHDSDVNSLFGGLSAYEKLSSLYRGRASIEIAVVAGARDDWTKAVVRIHEQMKLVKEKTGFDSIYFVSDGASDEQILPIISNYGRIIGVERIIVEQARNIEETYILLIRYVKKALTEPPYTKIFLGLPGIVLFLWGLLSILNLSGIVWSIITLVVGVLLMLKGFNVYGSFKAKFESSPIVSVLYLLSAIFLGIAIILSGYIVYVNGLTIMTIINLIDNTLYPYFIGLILIFGGRVFERVIMGKFHLLWRDTVLLSLVILLTVIVLRVRENLTVLIENPSTQKLFSTIFTPETIFLLLLTVIIVFVLTIFFTILEKTAAVKKQ